MGYRLRSNGVSEEGKVRSVGVNTHQARLKEVYQRDNQGQTNMSNFHPLEVVGRGSETQLQVGENLQSIM